MLTKRIIPCLDVKDGRVVKGKNFLDLVDAGDPVKLAKGYYQEGADEIVFLDITATYEDREIMLDVVKNVAKEIFIPFTVGGGINSIQDMRVLLNAGADKISINTAAVKNPQLIRLSSEIFGSQCIVVAVDVKKNGKKWEVFTKGGRANTGMDAIKWIKTIEKIGGGEILLTSMDCDGTKRGYDIELIEKVTRSVNIPIIASGGAGKMSSVLDVFEKGNADAALIASALHFKRYGIKELKEYLQKNNMEIR
jgi:imidazole glycerol-phosphate synthase subunit HisF